MPGSDPHNVSRFVHVYKGIEDFYFLNRGGELGYIKSGELRSVKEPFPQLRDRAFRKANPDFMPALEQFLRDLGEITTAYQGAMPFDLELGYILPADDRHLWRTATLVLHKHVLDTLKADHGAMLQNGTRELVEAERHLSRIMAERSIHQGLDELTYHNDVFGRYRYFPALYLVPVDDGAVRPDAAKSRVRVINLRWPGRGFQSRQYRSREAERTRELVFRVLRENLTQRGAIDRSQRAENRLSIA